MEENVVGIELPDGLFAGRTAIVTGASRGVGRATALRLAEAGADVVINYLSNDAEGAETVELCKNKGVGSIFVKADVSEFVGAQEISKQTLAEIKIEDEEFYRPLAAIHKKNKVLSPAMKQFLNVLKASA